MKPAEEGMMEAGNSGLDVLKEGNAVRLVRNPPFSPKVYEELSVDPSTGEVAYFSLLPTQFMDTFLGADEDYLQVPFIKKMHEQARQFETGQVWTEEEVEVGMASRIIFFKEACSPGDIATIVKFFSERSEAKQKEPALYEMLNAAQNPRYSA